MPSLLALAPLLIAIGSGSPATKLPGKSSTFGPEIESELRPGVGAFGKIEIRVQPDRVLAQNLQAAAVLYQAAALEQMHLFEVADRIANLFASGELPVSGASRSRFEAYLRDAPQRLSADSRRRMYGHVLGGSETGAADPNLAFAGLMTRFVRSVSEYRRQIQPSKKKTPHADSSTVHAAARSLAQNLSNRTYGAPVYASAQLARQISQARALLSDPQVLSAFGARDMWHLVDRVAKRELGKKANANRHRKRAESGAAIIRWLGSSAAMLSEPEPDPQLTKALKTSGVIDSAHQLEKSGGAKAKARPATDAKIHAVCFDAKRQLVPCKVTN